MKTKSNPKLKLPVLSRLAQKTFIIVAALAYISSAVWVAKYYFDVLNAGDALSLGLYSMYPIVTVVAPLVTFIAVYLISNEKVTKLWRMCKAMIITLMAMIFQAFAAMANTFIFSKYLGYSETPAQSYSFLLELVPVVLAVAIAVAVSLVVSKSKSSNTSDASTLLQKIFLVIVLVFGLGQPALSLIGYPGGSQAQTDPGMIIGVIASFAIPAIILGVIYLLTSKQRTVLQRSFITLFYVTLGIVLTMVFSSLSFLLGNLYANNSYSGVVMYLPDILALVTFVGIVAWHKKKNLL